ncbi:hypothetical protein H4R24_002652 [Coemansia sp. RSA 988]|nr:hypothetical protein H4R24_002652 [Coemansia sp. RSA 988]
MGRGSNKARKANSVFSAVAPNIQIAGAKKHKAASQPAPSTPSTERPSTGISIAGTNSSVQSTKPPALSLKKSKEGISIATTKHVKGKQEAKPHSVVPAPKSTTADGIIIVGKSRAHNGDQQKQQSPKGKHGNSSTITKPVRSSSGIGIAGSTSTKPKQKQKQTRKQQNQQLPRHTDNRTAATLTSAVLSSEGIAISGASTQDNNSNKHDKAEEHANKQTLVIKRRKSVSRDSSPMPLAKRRSVFGVHFERALRFNSDICENSSDGMEGGISSTRSEGYSALAVDFKPIAQSPTASIAFKDENKTTPQRMHNIRGQQQLSKRRLSDPVKMHGTQQNISKRHSINQRVKIPIDKPQVRYVVPMDVLGVQEQLSMQIAQSMSNSAYLGAMQSETDNTQRSLTAPRAKKRNKKPATRDCGITACLMESSATLPKTAMAIDSSSNSPRTPKKGPEQATTSTAGSDFAIIQSSSLETQVPQYTQEQYKSIDMQNDICSDIEIDPIVDFDDFDNDMNVQ